jgi:tripeptide aminopeptidase
LFDVHAFGADYAYTIDGGELGELEYENFNAAGALVTFKGRNIHPGYAKNKMVNSMLLAMEFNSLLPAHERPEHTTGYEGFIHLTKLQGDVEESKIHYIIRHHFDKDFEQYKQLLRLAADFMNQKYGENTVIIQVTEQYKNMRKMIEPVIEIVNKAEKAMLSAGVVPLKKAIRGGTDGARLSFMGLPTPNIFGGGHNFHGKYEYIPIQSMQKAVEVIINIAKI